MNASFPFQHGQQSTWVFSAVEADSPAVKGFGPAERRDLGPMCTQLLSCGLQASLDLKQTSVSNGCYLHRRVHHGWEDLFVTGQEWPIKGRKEQARREDMSSRHKERTRKKRLNLRKRGQRKRKLMP